MQRGLDQAAAAYDSMDDTRQTNCIYCEYDADQIVDGIPYCNHCLQEDAMKIMQRLIEVYDTTHYISGLGREEHAILKAVINNI